MPFLGPIINGGSNSAGSIALDMYFSSTTARDAWTVANPGRLFQGVTCAVGSTTYRLLPMEHCI